MVGKEINAVNSEWLLSRQEDSFIQQRTAGITGKLISMWVFTLYSYFLCHTINLYHHYFF